MKRKQQVANVYGSIFNFSSDVNFPINYDESSKSLLHIDCIAFVFISMESNRFIFFLVFLFFFVLFLFLCIYPFQRFQSELKKNKTKSKIIMTISIPFTCIETRVFSTSMSFQNTQTTNCIKKNITNI